MECRTPSEIHTSNIQRARTERFARRVVRLGNLIGRSPEGRSDYSLCNDKTQNGTTRLSGAKRYKIVPAPFSSISFPARGKRYGRRRPLRFSDEPEKSMPPEALRRKNKNQPRNGWLFLPKKLSTCGCGLFTNLLFTTAQQMFHKNACGQIYFPRTLTCGQITVENTGQNPVFHIKFPY